MPGPVPDRVTVPRVPSPAPSPQQQRDIRCTQHPTPNTPAAHSPSTLTLSRHPIHSKHSKQTCLSPPRSNSTRARPSPPSGWALGSPSPARSLLRESLSSSGASYPLGGLHPPSHYSPPLPACLCPHAVSDGPELRRAVVAVAAVAAVAGVGLAAPGWSASTALTVFTDCLWTRNPHALSARGPAVCWSTVRAVVADHRRVAKHQTRRSHPFDCWLTSSVAHALKNGYKSIDGALVYGTLLELERAPGRRKSSESSATPIP